MTMPTAVIAIVLSGLSACGSDEAGTATTETTSSPTPAPTQESPAVIGDWEIPAEDYALHLKADGTFVQDYMGIKDFRTGTYTVDGDTISLIGGDGETDKGTIKDDTLVFTLGTATRVE